MQQTLNRAIYILCFNDIESLDHLFIQFLFAIQIQDHFHQSLALRDLPTSLSDFWGPWRSRLREGTKEAWDTLSRALIWNVWFERNKRILDDCFFSSMFVFFKVSHMFILWMFVAHEQKRQKLEESAHAVKRSLEFTDPMRGELSSP